MTRKMEKISFFALDFCIGLSNFASHCGAVLCLQQLLEDYMKTIMVNPKTVTRQWKLIDAEGKPLGRVASAAARLLMGKHKAIYSPNVDTGDFVVIINAGKVGITGKKAQQKQYFHHTGHIGGERWISYEALMAKHPTEPLMEAIWGMLPHSSLGKKMLKKLKIYAGAEQPHAAQHLETVTIDF